MIAARSRDARVAFVRRFQRATDCSVRSSIDSVPWSPGMGRLMTVGTECYEVAVRIISEFAPRPQMMHL